MLKNVSKILLFSTSLFTLFACSGGDARDVDFYGFVEGTYSFAGAEGTLPEGWKFDENSKFDFIKAGAEEEFDEKTALPTGVWQNYNSYTDAEGKLCTYRNYHMVWKNTPFDALSGLSAGGVYTTPGICHRVMYDNTVKEGEKGEWSEFSMIECAISSLSENDSSKRKVDIVFNYPEKAELASFKVTFSM